MAGTWSTGSFDVGTAGSVTDCCTRLAAWDSWALLIRPRSEVTE